MSKKKQPMLPETKSKILGVMKESFASLGFPTLLDGAEKLAPILKDNEGLGNDLVAGLVSFLEGAKSKYFETAEEPAPEELEQMLAQAKAFRFQMRPILKKVTKDALIKMPHPPGGHPPSLTEEQRILVCHEIAQLHEQGKLLRVAFVLLGKKYHTSARTIERVWRSRAKRTEPSMSNESD
jgi:hypothetical protein